MTSSPQDGFRRIRTVTSVFVALGVVGTAAVSTMAYSDTHISKSGGVAPSAQVAAADPSGAGTEGGSVSGSSASSTAGTGKTDPSGSGFGVAPQLSAGSGGYNAQSSGS